MEMPVKKTMENKKNSFEKIYEVVAQIPPGKVATYGQIAALAGNRHWSRVVGYALHVNPDPDRIPCFRVVNRFGEISSAFAFGGGNRQIELLEAEGIPCPDGRVDLKKYQWERGKNPFDIGFFPLDACDGAQASCDANR